MGRLSELINCYVLSKVILFGALILLLAIPVSAQQHDAIWVFGQNAGIDFRDTSSPVAFRSKTYSFENTASIADSNGNLLFYLGMSALLGNPTMEVINSTLHTIPNGNINSHPTNARGSLIIPSTAPLAYHLFYTGRIPLSQCNTNWCSMLYHAWVIKDTSGWVLAHKDQLILPFKPEEGIVAAKHSNGRDWWILGHKRQTPDDTICNSTFFRFLVSGDSIKGPFLQDIGIGHCLNIYQSGSLIVSPQNDRLAYVNSIYGFVEAYKLSRCTGELFDHTVVDSSNGFFPYGAEFSPQGKLLYVTSDPDFLSSPSSGLGSLYQYSLDSPNVSASQVEIWNDQHNINQPGQLKLAPDGRIYLAYSSGLSILLSTDSTMRFLSFINQPDSLGMQCDFRPFAFPLADSTYSHMSLPNMPNYNLGPQGVFLATAGDDTVYCPVRDTAGTRLGNPALPHVVYRWHPSTGLDDTTVAQPLATPTQSTWYYLTATDTTASTCGINYDSVYVEFKDCGVGIAQTISRNGYKLKPNFYYSNYSAEVTLKIFETGELIIYDLVGHQVSTHVLGEGRNNLTLSEFSQLKGIFIYKVYVNGIVKHVDKVLSME